ncbi:MAG: hypothetical protein PSV16_02435 [Flavobacterium sp.]|nr:hypothetical protein [Flavobacterium sp.]
MAKMLQAKINAIQGLGKVSREHCNDGLLPFSNAFPDGVFPVGTIHECISYEPAEAASTTAFITAITGKLMKESGLVLWIGNDRKIFPPGLNHFGLTPDRIVFITVSKTKEALWAIEEALKCEALTCVVGEIKELGFTDSRRLQLAVERSGVTGFIHRYRPFAENTVACTTRWRITPITSAFNGMLSGVGHSCWDVQLLKVKNGRPNSWKVRWSGDGFLSLEEQHRSIPFIHERTAG